MFGDQLSYTSQSPFGFGGLGGLNSLGVGLGNGVGSNAGFRNDFLPGQSILITGSPQISNAAIGEVSYALNHRASLTFVGSFGLLDFVNAGFQNSSYATFQGGYNYLLDRKNSIAVFYRFNDFWYANPSQAFQGIPHQNLALTKDDMPKLKEALQKSIQEMSDFDKLKNQIEITITSEGLRIELLEAESGTFFKSGSAKPTQNGEHLLSVLAAELGKLPNKVSLEGHTDSKPFVGVREYDNWELSTDRANAARRFMQQEGLGKDQVSQVRGFADQRLRKPDNPLDASNRRITLIVQYMAKEKDEAEPAPASSPEETKPTAPEAGQPEH